MCFVHTRRLPGWALPVAGGLLFTAIVVLWWTGALWYLGVEGVALTLTIPRLTSWTTSPAGTARHW